MRTYNTKANRPYQAVTPRTEMKWKDDQTRSTDYQVKKYFKPERTPPPTKLVNFLMDDLNYGERYNGLYDVHKPRDRSKPMVYIEIQEELPRGAYIWGRDYKDPVDSYNLNKGIKETGDAAHLVALFHPNSKAGKRFEYYQAEDVTHKLKGQAVPVEERIRLWKQLPTDSEGNKYTLRPRLKKGKWTQEKIVVKKPTTPLSAEGPTDPVKTGTELTSADIIKLDLEKKGMWVDPGSKFGGLFIARPNQEYDPDIRKKISHATTIIVPTDNKGEAVPWWAVMGFQRAAKAGRKQLVAIPVPHNADGTYDKDKDIKYIEAQRIGGGRSSPRQHRGVRQTLDNSNVPYEQGFWFQTFKKPTDVHASANNRFFAGPKDHHLTRAERKGQWSSFWDAPNKVRRSNVTRPKRGKK